MRINSLCLYGLDIEEIGIKQPDIFLQQVTLGDIRSAMVESVGVVVGIHIESFLGYLGQDVLGLSKEFP